MKHLVSFQLFENKIFENRYITPHNRPQIKDSTLIATNTSSYYYSHDDTATDYNLIRMARLYIDNNDMLWLEIREEGSVESPYRDKSEWQHDEELCFEKIGPLSKPDLMKVRHLLSPETGSNHKQGEGGGFGFMKGGWASGFKKNWLDVIHNNEKGSLSDILKNYKSNVGVRPEKNRDDIIEEIGAKVQSLSDAELRKLLSKLGGSGLSLTPVPSAPKPRIEEDNTPPRIVEYSDRAIAVFGNTRSMKDELLHIGGKFNRWLTDPETKERQSGWIFPMSKRAEVEGILNK